MLLLNFSILILIPALLLIWFAQSNVKSTFQRYAKIPAYSNLNGAQAARRILDQAGLNEVKILVGGKSLSDHYNPVKRTLVLSEEVGRGSSLAALGVAAHEAGHALQHAKSYLPLMIRQQIYPLAALSSNLAIPLVLMGLFIGLTGLIDLGILLFSGALVFQLITLPVEFDASKRALLALTSTGAIINREELSGASKVLNAAALTYVASAIYTAVELIRLIFLRNSLR